MNITVEGDRVGSLASNWVTSLADLCVRYPDRSRAVRIRVLCHSDVPSLEVGLVDQIDSTDDAKVIHRFIVSTTRLTYFPGKRLARAWLAAAWAGYVQHEALELVADTMGVRPIDPHSRVELDRGLRDGFPADLTPASLLATLRVVMEPSVALRFVESDPAAW